MLSAEFFGDVRRRPAAGGEGRCQYEDGFDGPLLRIFAGEQIAEDRYVFQYRNAADDGELLVLSHAADNEAFTLPDAIFFIVDAAGAKKSPGYEPGSHIWRDILYF